MYLCNRETYGHLPVPLHTRNSLRDEADNFLHTLLEVMGEFRLTMVHDDVVVKT